MTMMLPPPLACVHVQAIENFQKAADYFAAENATSSAQKAEHRVGRLNAML